MYASVCEGMKKAPTCGAFVHAPERTRTSTDHKVHKALNHVRAAWMLSAASRSSKSRGLLDLSEGMGGVDVVTSVVTLAAVYVAPDPADGRSLMICRKHASRVTEMSV